MIPRTRIIAAVALLLCACSGNQPAAIDIADAWSPAAPPTASTLAVYADITAHRADTLLSVSTPAAGSAQLHATTDDNGMMRMREVPQLQLVANQTVHLAPGGMHLMLMDIREVPAAGAQIPLTLHFAEAGDITVEAQVRAP